MIHERHHHSHDHEHEHEHSHTHTHSHNPAGGHSHEHSEFDKVLALMHYMLDHNRQHTSELEAMADKLTEPSHKDAAALLRESAALYAKGNDKLAESLRMMKEV